MKTINIVLAVGAAAFMLNGCTGANPTPKEQMLVGKWKKQSQTISKRGTKVSGAGVVTFYDNKTMRSTDVLAIKGAKGKNSLKMKLTTEYMWSVRGDNLNLNLLRCKVDNLRKPKGPKGKLATKMISLGCNIANKSKKIQYKTKRAHIDSVDSDTLIIKHKKLTRIE